MNGMCGVEVREVLVGAFGGVVYGVSGQEDGF